MFTSIFSHVYFSWGPYSRDCITYWKKDVRMYELADKLSVSSPPLSGQLSSLDKLLEDEGAPTLILSRTSGASSDQAGDREEIETSRGLRTSPNTHPPITSGDIVQALA